jgi:hypothetical protein
MHSSISSSIWSSDQLARPSVLKQRPSRRSTSERRVVSSNEMPMCVGVDVAQVDACSRAFATMA